MYNGSCDGVLHPFSPYHQAHAIGDDALNDAQATLYYLCSRLRAILLHRMNIPSQENIPPTWNSHFAIEMMLANSIIGWVTVKGITLHIPYLLRSICSKGFHWRVQTDISITPDMVVLLLQEPDADLSPYLAHAPKYLSQWWNIEGTTFSPPLSAEEISLAKQYHLEILGKPVFSIPLPSRDPLIVNSNPECNGCKGLEELLRQTEENLQEAITHIDAMTQFITFASAWSMRRRSAFTALGNEALAKGRPLTREEAANLAAIPLHPGSGLNDNLNH
ncbi:hypothetical protein CVT26_012214 [Gymnopilus dilepis]|uniref:Uncharacterized protein n=1 Tax=Gymnopilus dilepis TaxID=231916 RepID=A0A409X922_9AGAR|nr:hypothetical protein CVT26_012214 [Gymnopilus dilepis]